MDFRKKTYILDGAMGTMMQRMGMKAGEDSIRFAYDNPDVIEKIQTMYVEAGADIIYAPTFNLNEDKVREMGVSLEELIAGLMAPTLKVRDKMASQGREIFAALDMGLQGELLEPMGSKTFEDAYDFFAKLVRAGAGQGADLAVIETMTDLYETKAALLAVKENSDLPVIASMSFEENGRTFTGTSIEAMVATLEGMGADALGINCSLGPIQILPLIKRMMECTSLPVFAKPNAGLPDPETGDYDISCEEFIAEMKKYIVAGASMVGGCCGTDPEYIRGIAQYRDSLEGTQCLCRKNEVNEEMEAPGRSLTVCSSTKTVRVDHVSVIGERLNPTGKKKLKAALLEGNLDYIVEKALEQVEAGAEILDVNVGVPGLDEAAVIGPLVKKLQSVTDVPLQIDSANVEVIEAGLRVYNGKAIVNSVNGEPEVMDRILPVVKKYGAAVIGLTLDDSGIPETSEQRFEIAQRILKRAGEYGIPARDVIIDCLTLTASAQQKEVDETLKTVRRVSRELGLNTALGVSNVSFGLPLRPVINRTFLTMAMENGLTLPIINPNDEDMMASVMAYNVLKNVDVNAAAYIDRYSASEAAASIVPKGTAKAAKAAKSPSAPGSPDAAQAGAGQKSAGGKDIYYFVENGLDSETAAEVSSLMENMDGLEIVNQHLIPALDKIGKGFEKGEIFLPQMVQAAQAAQAGFDVIKKAMEESGQTGPSKGKVAIGTVKGDIHDIGKNIVKVIMENFGFEMIDLGRDVPIEKVVETVQEHDLKLVGLSALMTTTLGNMEETIRAVRAAAPECRVMVGGAVLTADYAEAMGADFYCSDAMKSVEAAQKVFDVK